MQQLKVSLTRIDILLLLQQLIKLFKRKKQSLTDQPPVIVSYSSMMNNILDVSVEL